jgi:DNA gyrase subunit A
VARSLPGEHGRRDGSGIPLSQAVDAIGPSMAWSDAAEAGTGS